MKKFEPEHKTGMSVSLWDYSISFIVNTDITAENYHHCYKVIVSLDHSFRCLIDGQNLQGLKGIIVNQTIPYSTYTSDTTLLINFIEADSSWGLQLRSLLDNKAWLNIDSILTPEKVSEILPADYSLRSNQELMSCVSNFLDSIFQSRLPIIQAVTDERIHHVLRYIDENLHKPLKLEDIASESNVSADRMRHIFVGQMHIPFSQYLLWRRIRKVMAATINKEIKLNDACFQYGFTDQSHFNKTFKRTFGITPGVLIREARFLL